MFIYTITEYATVLLLVLVATMLLFTVCLIFLAFEAGCRVAVRKVKRSLTNGDIPLFGNWRTAETCERYWSRPPLPGS